MTITQESTGTIELRAIEVRAIDPPVAAELRIADDAGRPPRVAPDRDGGSPLRCCLRRSSPGEPIALVSYAPLRRWAMRTGADPGPYDEIGPVFIHPRQCHGQHDDGYPAEFLGSPRVLRAYTAGGRIHGGRLATAEEVRDQAGATALLEQIFADPRVAVVHARAVEFGCFTFEIRRRPR